jgi:putative exporter of polyketide antibiotics
MDSTLLIPITWFICIAYAIKAVVDAYSRRRMIESRGSEELVRALLEGDAARRRQASLHWGSVLLALAIGFGLVELTGADRVTPGVIALLLGATGLGNLAYYGLQRKFK